MSNLVCKKSNQKVKIFMKEKDREINRRDKDTHGQIDREAKEYTEREEEKQRE
jgi:hypothetical protein